MLRNRKVRYRKRLRARALATGNVHDITDIARTCGIHVPVAISRAIWTSLIEPFPGAGPKDLIPLDSLLQDVSRIAFHELDKKWRLRHFTPSMRPRWLSRQFVLRLEVVQARGQIESVVICAETESFFSGHQESPIMLPGTLLWRLHRTLFDLSLVARAAESKIIERMESIVAAMLRASPVGQCIDEIFSGTEPSLPAFLTQEEYRWLLLRSLAELLVCLGACPAGHDKFIAMLVAQNRAMISPLSDLTVITEGLLSISNRLIYPLGPFDREPFSDLLAAYHGMRVALDRGSTFIAAAFLQSVRSQIQAMRTRVKRADERQFDSLSQWFRNIDPDSGSGPVVDLAYRSERSIVWQ